MTARQMRDRIDALSQEVEILGKRVRELTEENAALRSAGRA
jgi:regulator of replication initiation timing